VNISLIIKYSASLKLHVRPAADKTETTLGCTLWNDAYFCTCL